MFRATVREVKSPTDVVVTIDKLFGGGMVRARSRIEVTAGERVLVDDLSAGRVHDWMVVDFENAIGRWGSAGPHTHPIGQVDGLKDFLDTYGEFMGDHEDRMKYAEGKLVEADAAIAQGKLDMAQAEADLAAARDRITKAETELTYADQRIAVGEAERAAAIVRLDSAELEILAAGKRIGATENLLSTLDNRVESAETTVQVTAGKLDTVDTRLTTTAGELAALSGTVGNVSAAVATAEGKAARAEAAANQASTVASEAMSEYDGLRVKLDAALAARPGLITDSSFELADQWITSGGNIIADVNARTGNRVYAVPASTSSQWAYSATAVPVEKDHNYRFVAYVRPDSTLTSGALCGRIAKPGAGGPVFVTATSPVSLPEATTVGVYSRVELSWTATETGTFHIGPQLFNNDSRVLVEDFQVTDSTAEASLQIAVEGARQKAEAAARDAVEALTAANQAQTAANGKTNVLYTTTPYAGMGTAMGDTNFVMSSLGGGGKVLRQRRWTGNSWEDVQFDHQVIASVDLGKATVGELDGIRIKANSVTADKVTIGIGQNLVPNANATTGTAPHIFYGGGTKTVSGSTFGTVFFSALSQGTWGDVGLIRSGALAPNGRNGDFLINSRSEYVFRMRVKRSWSTGNVRVKASVYDMSGKIVKNVFTPDTPLSTTWLPLEVRLSGADVAAGVSVALIIQTTRDGEYWFETLDFRELTDGALVVNGTITGDKVNAESVAAKIGQFVKVQANNVEVTEDLSARVVNAMTTNTKNLVVTESAILQHTTLLGTTVADELNVTKLLRGRDAILSGTIDVAQLNVTNTMSAAIVNAMDVATQKLVVTEEALLNHATLLGTTVAERLNVTKQLIGRDAILTGTVDVHQLNVTNTMSAEIVRAMDTTTKRLIVTEDAILNRATIVQDLVTRDLIAQRVDSRYLRSDSIQTGLLEVFGRFRTAPDGQPQIIIQPSQAAWNNRDLAVWFTPDGTTPGGGDAAQFAVTGGMWMNPTRNTGTSWSPQQLNLRGQSRAGVQVMDGLTMRTTAGTIGPAINSYQGQQLTLIGSTGLGMTTLSGDARITPWGSIELLARNGNVYVESRASGEVRLNGGSGGVRFTDQTGTVGQYSRTTGTAANMNMTSAGLLYRVTSSLRYKENVETWEFDPTRMRDMRLTTWNDKKHPGIARDQRRHVGAIAEEVADLYPEVVLTIPDPSHVDDDGNPLPGAPQVPDSIQYDRLALAAAVTGWQDADRRLRALEEKLATLGV